MDRLWRYWDEWLTAPIVILADTRCDAEAKVREILSNPDKYGVKTENLRQNIEVEYIGRLS